MSRAKPFRYVLQPVLTTRQWTLDALMQDLQEANAAVAEAEERLAALRKRIEQAGADQKQSMASSHFSADQVALFARYMQELNERRREQHGALSELEEERDALIERVMHARRRVDAVEKHREKAHRTFMRLHAGVQCKADDDQWLMLQAHRGMS
ncbi:MAG TPA: flagellar FliJ family protein [Paucimonas sp.]|nr:flagellar FliJ family protein [Paucimonas sp.]